MPEIATENVGYVPHTSRQMLQRGRLPPPQHPKRHQQLMTHDGLQNYALPVLQLVAGVSSTWKDCVRITKKQPWDNTRGSRISNLFETRNDVWVLNCSTQEAWTPLIDLLWCYESARADTKKASPHDHESNILSEGNLSSTFIKWAGILKLLKLVDHRSATMTWNACN